MTRYMVFEGCGDFEQALVLLRSRELPPDGILSWAKDAKKDRRATFDTKKDAYAAIRRTEHYRMAFDRSDLPIKEFCYVVPIYV